VEIPLEEIAGRECRFVYYVPPPERGMPDRHYIKEIIHTKDGRVIPRLVSKDDIKRPFFVTKPGYRKEYKQRKEWEDITKCDRFKCRQFELVPAIAKALGEYPNPRNSLKQAVRTPYVYAADIPSTTLIKRMYRKRYPNHITPYSVAVFDIEADVVHGHRKILMASLTMKNKAIIAITEEALVGFPNPEVNFRKALDKYILKDEKLGPIVASRNLNVEFKVVKNDFEVIKIIFARAHEWKPDFFAIWNMSYDIPKVMECCAKYGVECKDIFSDPSVPQEYKFFKFAQGQAQKVSDSGKKSSLDYHRQWHSVYAPASFWVMDPMCLYKQIRIGAQEEESYSLDHMLGKVLKLSKMKFTEADGLEKEEWHAFMQRYHMIEYAVYNLWDCISVELFDEATLDMQLSVAAQSVDSGFDVFNKMPRKIVEFLDDFIKPYGKVMGTTSDQMSDELDTKTLSNTDWIVALNAVQIVDNGLCIFADAPHIRTRMRRSTGDLDVTGAYPNNGIALNQSKETTKKELITIIGVDEYVFRAQNMNLTGGSTNASQYVRMMMKGASHSEMLNLFHQLHPNNEGVVY